MVVVVVVLRQSGNLLGEGQKLGPVDVMIRNESIHSSKYIISGGLLL